VVTASPAAYAAPKKAAKAIRPILPSPEKDAAVIEDGATGKVLYARNPDAIRYPASLTKMMTLYLMFEALEQGKMALDTPMIVSTHAAEQEPTKLYAPLGSSIPVETAIKALTVLSANDVAVVIAEALGGSEENFATMMTEKAHQLGMLHSNFHNASGLPDLQQLTTARDMALLGRHLAYDFPQYFRYFSVTGFNYNGRNYSTHDNLLAAFNGTDGIKTGYTQLSGFNLVTSAVRDNKHVIGVVMGGPTAAVRDREMMRLLSAAFNVANDNPTYLADADAPWKGGPGPGGELYKADPGEDNLMVAALEAKPKSKKGNQTVLAGLKTPKTAPIEEVVTGGSQTVAAAAEQTIVPIITPAVQSATMVPVLKSSNPIPKEHAPRIGPAPVLTASAAPVTNLAQGDSGSATPPAVFTPKVAEDSTVKRWAIQIGAFASEALAKAKLAAFAKRGADVIGQAEKLIVPFPSVNGRMMYRARFGMFAESEARDICKQMVKRGQTCFAAPVDASTANAG
jgi:D-alanyl-D-alanine carboxypeptidase